MFLQPGAREFYVDWYRAARDVVAVLRWAAGRDPYDRDLSDLVGELSTQSEEFRPAGPRTTSAFHDTGVKDLHHSVVGDLTLTYNRMALSADPGLTIMIYTAEPGSKSADEVVRIVVELRDGDPVSELSQTAVAATSGAAVSMVAGAVSIARRW